MTIVSLFDEQPPEQERGPEPGGFWIRAGAHVIDWVVTSILGVLGVFTVALFSGLFVVVTHHQYAGFLPVLRHPSWFQYVIGIVVTITYEAMCESVGGATLGKRLCGLQVVSESFGPVTLMQGIKRSVAFFIDGFFFGAVAWHHMSDSPMKQRLGDSWAETYVVKRGTLPEAQQRTMKIFLAALIAGSSAAMFIDVAWWFVEIALQGVP